MSFSAFEIADFGQFALPTSFFFLNVFFLRELLFYMQFSRCLVGSSGLEPPTSRLSGVRSNQLSYEPSSSHFRLLPLSPILKNGGGKRIRTDDPLLAKQVLYQLSYTPVCRFASRSLCPFECASQHLQNHIVHFTSKRHHALRDLSHGCVLPRKEVIQPHLPIRLPCYDFTPVIGLAFDGSLLTVRIPASGAPNSHGVTGGVYKARERIHRGILIRDY